MASLQRDACYTLCVTLPSPSSCWPCLTFSTNKFNRAGDCLQTYLKQAERAAVSERAQGASDILYRHRMRLLGGAVPVPLGSWIGRNLTRACMYRHKYLGTPHSETVLPNCSASWPHAVFSMGTGQRIAARFVGLFPVAAPFVPLFELITPSGPVVPPAAIREWLKRMDSAGWSLPNDVDKLIRTHCEAAGPVFSVDNIPATYGEVGFVCRPDFSLWPALFLNPGLETESCCIPAPLAEAVGEDDSRIALLLGFPKGEWQLSSTRHFLPFAPFRVMVEQSWEIGSSAPSPHEEKMFADGIRNAEEREAAQQRTDSTAGEAGSYRRLHWTIAPFAATSPGAPASGSLRRVCEGSLRVFGENHRPGSLVRKTVHPPDPTNFWRLDVDDM